MPITWRTINDPNFNTTAALTKSGGQALSDSLRGFANQAQGERKLNIANEARTTEDALNNFRSQLLNAKSPEEYAAVTSNINQSGLKNKAAILGEAQTASRAEDDYTRKLDLRERSDTAYDLGVDRSAEDRLRQEFTQGRGDAAYDANQARQQVMQGREDASYGRQQQKLGAQDAVNTATTTALNENDRRATERARIDKQIQEQLGIPNASKAGPALDGAVSTMRASAGYQEPATNDELENIVRSAGASSGATPDVLTKGLSNFASLDAGKGNLSSAQTAALTEQQRLSSDKINKELAVEESNLQRLIKDSPYSEAQLVAQDSMDLGQVQEESLQLAPYGSWIGTGELGGTSMVNYLGKLNQTGLTIDGKQYNVAPWQMSRALKGAAERGNWLFDEEIDIADFEKALKALVTDNVENRRRENVASSRTKLDRLRVGQETAKAEANAKLLRAAVKKAGATNK